MKDIISSSAKESLKTGVREFLQKNAERLRAVGEHEITVGDCLIVGGVLIDAGALVSILTNPEVDSIVTKLIPGELATGTGSVLLGAVLLDSDRGMDILMKKIPDKITGESLKFSSSVAWLADVYDGLAEKIK
ncbi:hypothetical protein HYV64_00625 [Candidatus Shapirobacteria bacterium]|nr:hypothetical protein [Candidatus Shapirobacteria bacterium]